MTVGAAHKEAIFHWLGTTLIDNWREFLHPCPLPITGIVSPNHEYDLKCSVGRFHPQQKHSWGNLERHLRKEHNRNLENSELWGYVHTRDHSKRWSCSWSFKWKYTYTEVENNLTAHWFVPNLLRTQSILPVLSLGQTCTSLSSVTYMGFKSCLPRMSHLPLCFCKFNFSFKVQSRSSLSRIPLLCSGYIHQVAFPSAISLPRL